MIVSNCCNADVPGTIEAHNLDLTGSTPVSATKKRTKQMMKILKIFWRSIWDVYA